MKLIPDQYYCRQCHRVFWETNILRDKMIRCPYCKGVSRIIKSLNSTLLDYIVYWCYKLLHNLSKK